MKEQYRINSCRLSCGGKWATGFLISPRQILTAAHVLPVSMDGTFPAFTAVFRVEGQELTYSVKFVKQQSSVAVLELEEDAPFYERILFLERDPGGSDYAKAFGFPSFQPDGCFSNLKVNTFYGEPADSQGCNLYLDCENRTGSLMGMSGAALIIDDEISGILLQERTANGEAFSVQALAGLAFRQILGDLEISIMVDNHYSPKASNSMDSMETIFRLNRENSLLRAQLDLVQNRKLSEIMEIHLLGDETRAWNMLKREIALLEQSPALRQNATYYLLAALWSLADGAEQSQQYLCRVVEIDPATDTRILESEQALMHRDFVQAESVLSPINNITLTNQRAKILYYKNDLDAAVSCFEKLPFPLSDASRILLSIIHLKRGSYEDGLVQVEYLRNLYPDSAKILAIQAHLLFGQAIETLNPHIQYGQALFVDSHYFLPNADQQAILAQVYQCLENLLRVTERGENPVLREWAYGMLVSVSMILPGKDARLWINHFQAQFPNSSLLVLAYLSCGLSVPGDLAEYCMNRLPNSGDNLQIKFRLLISQNRFEEADTLLREHSDEFVEMENASLADIRFSLLMQKQDWAMAADLAAKEPDGTGKRRMQYLINAWSGQQPKKAAAKKLLDFAKETSLSTDCANAYRFACVRDEWATAFKIAKLWYQLKPHLVIQMLKAESLTCSGHAAKALRLISQIEKEGGRSRTLLKLKTRCLQALGRQNEAIAYLENIRYEENDYDLLTLRVHTYLQLGRREDAVFCLKDYLNHGYKNKDVLLLLSEILKSTDLVEASRYATLCRQLYPEDRLVLSQSVQLALLAGINCEKDDFEQFNQLSSQEVDGFRQCNISEALKIIQENKIRVNDLLRKYQRMEYPIHIYTDALHNQSMGYLLYLQWSVGIINVVYPLFAAGPANSMIPEGTHIILDYTVCVSAFELGILDKACERWHCLISPHLLPIILQEIGTLNSVQVSQEESNQELKEQIELAHNLKQCTFTDTASCYFDAWYRVAKEKNLYIVCDDPLEDTDFSLPDDWEQIRVTDDKFLSYLVTQGVLSSNDLIGDEHIEGYTLSGKDGFLLGTSILYTLAERKLLVAVTDSIQTEILAFQYNEVLGRVYQARYRKAARDWLQRVYDKLADLIKTEKLSLLNTSVGKGDDSMPCSSLIKEEFLYWKDNQAILWCDDRFFNRMNAPSARIISILDILENLSRGDKIQTKRKVDMLLSRHVSAFLPSPEYVMESIKVCPEKEGSLRESSSLKNLRETVAATLCYPSCLIDEPYDNRVPERQIYLQRLFYVLFETLKAIWNNADKAEAWKNAASSWLVENLFILIPIKILEAGISDKFELLSSVYLITGLSIKGDQKKGFYGWLTRYLMLMWNASPELIGETANDIGSFLSKLSDKAEIMWALIALNGLVPFEGFLYELFCCKNLLDLNLIPFKNPYSPFISEKEGPFVEPSQELLDKFISGDQNAKEEILSQIFEQPESLGEYVVRYIEGVVAKGTLPCAAVLSNLYFYVPVHLRKSVRELYLQAVTHEMMANI